MCCRVALFGYENEPFEVWTYPLKILDIDSVLPLRGRATGGELSLVLEGLGGETYPLSVHAPHHVEETEGVHVEHSEARDTVLHVFFKGPSGEYQQRSLQLPLQER